MSRPYDRGADRSAGIGKTALLRCLRDAVTEARYHAHRVEVTGLSKRDMWPEFAVMWSAILRPMAPDRCSSAT